MISLLSTESPEPTLLPLITSTLSTLTLAEPSSTTPSPCPTETTTKPRIGIVFDIDGVLIAPRDPNDNSPSQYMTPLPHATQSIIHLQTHSIPFIIFTNRGQKYELSEHTQWLNEDLLLGMENEEGKGKEILEEQMVLTTSPLRDHVGEFGNEWVLFLGNHSGIELLNGMGFSKVIRARDIWRAYPNLESNPNPNPDPEAESNPKEKPMVDRIAAIIINKPDDGKATGEAQVKLVLELLLSKKGRPGTKSRRNGIKRLPNGGYLQEGQPKVFFTGFRSSWQHDFAKNLMKKWKAQTSSAQIRQNIMAFGKPSTKSFKYAERKLMEWNKKLCVERGEEVRELDEVYMIGDTPELDIRGTNWHNRCNGPSIPWKSVLVETGEYEPGEAFEEEDWKPDKVVHGVWDAVAWALGRKEEGQKGLEEVIEDEGDEDEEDEED